MTEAEIKEIVYKNYSIGFHCAESIANTIHEVFPEKSTKLCMATSGFCGGIGGCKEDVCGALSGGIIALGSIYGRQKGSCDNSELVKLSKTFRQLFIDEFKTTVCKTVIANMRNMAGYDGCKDVTAKMSWILYNLIKKQ